MKPKHIDVRIAQCLALSQLSSCSRRKFGALLLDPERNQIIGEGYNGPPRKGGELCGGDCCLRDTKKIPSGTQVEVGCHHAEMNVICNAAAFGTPTRGSWMFVTGEPCMMCAKLIHHAGISKVFVVNGGFFGENGVQYLEDHKVDVIFVDGPKDPRGQRPTLEGAGLLR